MKLVRISIPIIVVLALSPGSGPASPGQGTPEALALSAEVEGHLASARSLLEQVETTNDPRTLSNTLEPLNSISIEVSDAAYRANLFANAHPNPEVRAAAEEAGRQVDAFLTELSLSRGVYDALLALDADALDVETRYLLETSLRDYRRSGVDKDPETREQIRRLRDELVTLGQAFDRNLREGRREIHVNPGQLQGLPDDYVAAHPPDESGRVTISTDYPDYFPVMTYAVDPEIRRDLFIEFSNRGFPENQEVLMELLRKRWELARLLGYASWADYITGDKMIGSAADARAFIEELEAIAATRSSRDYGLLLERKRRDMPEATEIQEWERSYYSELVKQETCAFDNREIRPYYNYPVVKQGMMDLSSALFGVTFTALPDAQVWHEDVECYEMREGDRLLGRFYLDMHPRDGKFSHAACFDLVTGIEGVRVPESVLVCNFPKPDSAGLSLMEHDQVETFLHEFGHLLHALFAGQQRWADQSGIEMERDFVEAPAQLLEEWVLDPPTLRELARHYETGEPIPFETIDRLRRAREFGDGLYIRQQNFYSAVSLFLHDRDPATIDLDGLLVETKERYSPYPYIPGTHMYVSFGHLVDYSAIYYTYMWSLVISKDLFSGFDRADLRDPSIAAAYRRSVLEPGGTLPATELVQAFLGRPFNFEAFDLWLNGSR